MEAYLHAIGNLSIREAPRHQVKHLLLIHKQRPPVSEARWSGCSLRALLDGLKQGEERESEQSVVVRPDLLCGVDFRQVIHEDHGTGQQRTPTHPQVQNRLLQTTDTGPNHGNARRIIS